MHRLIFLVAGAVGGFCFALSCNGASHGGADAPSVATDATSAAADALQNPDAPTGAAAQCGSWQVAYLEQVALPPGVDNAVSMPAGWEPVTFYGGGYPRTASIYLRRCAD